MLENCIFVTWYFVSSIFFPLIISTIFFYLYVLHHMYFLQLYFPILHLQHWFLFIVDLKDRMLVILDCVYHEGDDFYEPIMTQLVSCTFMILVLLF